jgi:hypothetical protein
MKAVEKTENFNIQQQLFEAVLNNDLEIVNKLV